MAGRKRPAPKKRKPHKGLYHPPEQVIGGGDPDSIWNHMNRWMQWMEERSYSYHTIEQRGRTLRVFAAWAAERGLMRPQEITRPILERWQRHLFLYRKVDGEPLAVASQRSHTHPLVAYRRQHRGDDRRDHGELLDMPIRRVHADRAFQPPAR